MSGFKGNKPSKFANRNSETSSQAKAPRPKPEKNKKVKPAKETSKKATTPKSKPKQQTPRTKPVREKPTKGGLFGKAGNKVSKSPKPKSQKVEEQVKNFNVYSYLKSEEYNPDITIEPSRYTKLLIKTLDKRNVAGIVSVKEADSVMQDIAVMVKEVRYLVEDSSDLIVDDSMYDDDVNDMGVHQYEPKRKRKRTKVEVI